MWKMTKKGLLVKVYIHSLAKWMFQKIFNKNSTLKQNYFVFFHCAICSQLLLLCIFEFISMNSFLNDSINIYLYKRLQCNVYGQLLFTFSLYLISLKNKRFIKFIKYDDSTAQKVFVFGVFLVCTFPHSDWILRFAEQIGSNAGKYGPEYLRTRTLFMQCSF